MQFQTPLIAGRLIRRYKRFLADIRLADGREITAHCANPGSMLGLAEPGARVWLEPNDDPKRKLKFSWKLVETAGGGLCVVDTGLANRVVAEGLAAGAIPDLAGAADIRAEVRYGENSRVDFLLRDAGGRCCYVEVKSVTLSRGGGLAEFPDSVTKRGAKHLGELAGVVGAGHRAVMLYLVMRDDCDRVGVAGDIDPAYAAASAQAQAQGVAVLAHRASIARDGVTIGPALPLAGNLGPGSGKTG